MGELDYHHNYLIACIQSSQVYLVSVIVFVKLSCTVRVYQFLLFLNRPKILTHHQLQYAESHNYLLKVLFSELRLN